MNNIGQIAVLGLALAVPGVCLPQASPSSPAHAPGKRPEGFLDYALGKINPSDKDYGASAADARREAVADSIQDVYFWSNMVSITLLAATSTVLVLMLRTREKREMIAATLISQLWNGRVVDRREIVRRTAMYNALVEAKNSALVQAVPANKDEQGDDSASERPTAKQVTRRNRVQSETATPKSPSSTGEIGALPPGELEQKARLLEGQNQALRNSERNLRERLNQVSQDLEQERRRNQTLKGA